MATLTVSDIAPRAQYTASNNQTLFAYPFPIFADADLKVFIGSTLQTLTTHYTVSGAATSSGGNVTLVTGAGAGDIVTIYRDLPVSRTSDYQTSGDLLAETLNDDLDKVVMMAQQNESSQLRSLSVRQTDNYGDMTLPTLYDRAGHVLAFDDSGDPESGPTIGDVTLAAATAEFETEIKTIARDLGYGGVNFIDFGDLTTTPSLPLSDSRIENVYQNLDDIEAVAGSSSNIDIVAGGISDVHDVATNLGMIQTVHVRLNEVQAVSLIASEVAAVAAINTHITAVNDNIPAIVAATTSAATASTKATEAMVSASGAALSATTAATAQGVAATQAGISSTASATAVAALDDFDNRYLGSKATAPVLGNDGDALTSGALYFNTTADVMNVYDGTVWVAAYASLSGAMMGSNSLSDVASVSAARTNLGLVIGTDVHPYDGTIIVGADIGVSVQAYDATIVVDADIGVSVQAYDATIVVDADIGVSVQAYDATLLTSNSTINGGTF